MLQPIIDIRQGRVSQSPTTDSLDLPNLKPHLLPVSRCKLHFNVYHVSSAVCV